MSAVKVFIPIDWVRNQSYDLLIKKAMVEADIPIERLDHMTPIVTSGDIADNLVAGGVEYTWTPAVTAQGEWKPKQPAGAISTAVPVAPTVPTKDWKQTAFKKA